LSVSAQKMKTPSALSQDLNLDSGNANQIKKELHKLKQSIDNN